ncbi:hypothetical protein HanRHA438_Chr09g0373861 [Helianthus annuus]|uniref:Uncharacterized protein n=1 Tax=Helianthus annuus TaxID=4232 RepID=A0A9K3I275_HELAN|nr:hypothetical protein HanXRQr2_Chr09g0362281 [Helianthus annuus]KAJ0540526.1 hypothetical protein HanHA89_Chr09g0317801 [Helianthus annuus]KAJ0705668.1 hypothetical protein HanLR1_Chr09g0297981 [Helianthus annuus]KAJ0885957.1 hypothetical protein HanRHA438_Chr09g0373861 [Helianthus annuus]
MRAFPLPHRVMKVGHTVGDPRTHVLFKTKIIIQNPNFSNSTINLPKSKPLNTFPSILPHPPATGYHINKKLISVQHRCYQLQAMRTCEASHVALQFCILLQFY